MYKEKMETTLERMYESTYGAGWGAIASSTRVCQTLFENCFYRKAAMSRTTYKKRILCLEQLQ